MRKIVGYCAICDQAVEQSPYGSYAVGDMDVSKFGRHFIEFGWIHDTCERNVIREYMEKNKWGYSGSSQKQ